MLDRWLRVLYGVKVGGMPSQVGFFSQIIIYHKCNSCIWLETFTKITLLILFSHFMLVKA